MILRCQKCQSRLDKENEFCQSCGAYNPYYGLTTEEEDDKRDALRDVGKYACAACGNISTSRCMLDYPVFISIPDDR